MIFIPLAIGIILGFISSTPLGPINLNVARLVQDENTKGLRAFIIGVVIADALAALLAFMGLLAAHFTPEVLKWIGLFGGGAFVFFGILGVLKEILRKKMASLSPPSNDRTKTNLVAGFLFCALNPAFYLFWVYGSSVLLSNTENTTGNLIAFLSGIMIGDLLWFGVFSKLIRLLKNKVPLGKLNLISNLLICIFGLIAVWRFA